MIVAVVGACWAQAVGLSGEMQHFEKPLFQNTGMFLGMFLCLFVYLFNYWKATKEAVPILVSVLWYCSLRVVLRVVLCVPWLASYVF